MSFLRELLDSQFLPAYFNTNPLLAQGITLVYSGTTATVTIADGILTTSVSDGSGAGLYIDLTGYGGLLNPQAAFVLPSMVDNNPNTPAKSLTLTQLVATINTYTGYTATLLGDGSSAALLLNEQTAISIANNPLSIPTATATLYKIMVPVAYEIAQTKLALDGALAEQLVFKADNGWIDYWGSVYGNITRLLGEDDQTYAARIIAEVTRNRLATNAIQDAVDALSSVQVSITSHQTDVVKITGQSILGQNIFEDRNHAGAQFVVSGLSENVQNDFNVHNIINANRAAGINPIYNYTSPPFSGCFVGPFMMDIFPIAPNN